MMSKSVTHLAAALSIAITPAGIAGEDSALSGPYLGQESPGSTPRLFAPGIVSTEDNELDLVLTPDGKEACFAVWVEGVNTIHTMKEVDGRWTPRAVASFSGSYSDVDPFVTADGKRLYFSSMRPLEKSGDPKDSDLWYVERTKAGGWGDPVRLATVNSPGKHDYYTSISADGTLYFSLFRTHGSPGDLYYSRLVDGDYSKPEQLEQPLNSRHSEHDPLIDPAGSFLIFTSDRPGGLGQADLYISFRQPAGTWSVPENMGERINSAGYEYCPTLSPDGKYLFFTRNSGGNGDIFWVAAKIIEDYRGGEAP